MMGIFVATHEKQADFVVTVFNTLQSSSIPMIIVFLFFFALFDKAQPKSYSQRNNDCHSSEARDRGTFYK